MDPLQPLWHWGNLLLLPCALALIHASLCKWLWRRHLAHVGWWRLTLWCAAAALVVELAGLVWTGHDGEMSTYAAMIGMLAVVTWWLAFAPWRQGAPR
ncbi:MAG: hypothetical protein IT503_16175 [Burkholderiaceae bacterium]|nr:hypothetical protein [Ideonella sp.]MCC7287711.1 hypothetical protein [Burkholderiaceae bacterium]